MAAETMHSANNEDLYIFDPKNKVREYEHEARKKLTDWRKTLAQLGQCTFGIRRK